jgi:hypothetical protein
MRRPGKPHSEQGQIGGQLLPRREQERPAPSSGRLLEPAGNVGPREMATGRLRRPQNSAYRPPGSALLTCEADQVARSSRFEARVERCRLLRTARCRVTLAPQVALEGRRCEFTHEVACDLRAGGWCGCLPGRAKTAERSRVERRARQPDAYTLQPTRAEESRGKRVAPDSS